MLDLPRYLLGVGELLLLAGFAGYGASAIRARLLPSFSAAPAILATATLALAILIWVAELLGSLALFEPAPYLIGVAAVGLGFRWGLGGGRPSRSHRRELAGPILDFATLAALLLAALAVIKFGIDLRSKLATGMTGFDSTWYHGPFAAGFFQDGDTWDLHFIAPQFLAWFYPANAEIFHGAGMLAFGRDLLSPLLNLGWFGGCLVACWCIGRPYRVAPWSLALGAVALSLPVLSDQAGEARNDIVGIFFLLAAVAIALNAWTGREGGQVGRGGPESRGDGPGAEWGPLLVTGLAAGLAAGTKLNFLLPAAVFVLGLAFVAPTGRRWKALATAGMAALAGGGYWYLRNLIHAGNPLPWFDRLGPIPLPAPDQALGGREGHSVLGYLTDGAVWSDWFLPGLHGGLTLLWPLFVAAALAGLLLCLIGPRNPVVARSRFGSDSDSNLDRTPLLPLVGLVGMAVMVAWLIAPTSASGPDGMARGFESGLRYLAPALILGLAVLPIGLLRWVASVSGVSSAGAESAEGESHPATGFRPSARSRSQHLGGTPGGDRPRRLGALVLPLAVAVIAIGYPVQRNYLENRYANPTFAASGLNAAFKWATPISGARIATTSTRQYPLYGTDLSNEVQYVGEEQPHGGFTAPTDCRQWRNILNAGDYDYVVTTRDRVEPGKPPYPTSTHWTEGLGVEEILRKPPTAVFKLKGPLDPESCRE